MLAPGQIIPLIVEKPAVGGRMIGRANGQVILVMGAIPGERVSARIERTSKGVVYAATMGVDEPSADRREPIADPLCGGCLYAHIDYRRQLAIKGQVLADAFMRIGRLRVDVRPVVGSPTNGYRMRARVHRDRTGLGFFREGTHEICDCRPTRQLLPATCDVLDQLGERLAQLPTDAVREVEVSENIDASDRAVHLHGTPQVRDVLPDRLRAIEGLTGISLSAPAGCHPLSGVPYVTDRLSLQDGTTLSLRRHVQSFFQGNRFLLQRLADHVVSQIPEGSRLIDLYAGGGLFSLAAARSRRATVTAVEGDRAAADDLAVNARSGDGAVTAVHEPVEVFVKSKPPQADAVLVDPPRTGLSRESLGGVVGLGTPRIVYVSCDVATLARDARRLMDSGYRLEGIDAFDLFPNTPHVEVVAVFEK